MKQIGKLSRRPWRWRGQRGGGVKGVPVSGVLSFLTMSSMGLVAAMAATPRTSTGLWRRASPRKHVCEMALLLCRMGQILWAQRVGQLGLDKNGASFGCPSTGQAS